MRHEQRAFHHLKFYPDAGELAGPQSVVWIWKQRRDSQRYGARADLSIRCVNLSLQRIDSSIRQDQFNFQLAESFITVALRGEKFGEVDVSLFGNVVIRLDGIDGRNGG